jgi:cytidine deaminase
VTVSEDQLERLLEAAAEVRSHAYAPYSGFRVGAAALANGRLFSAANVENASYPISICAERGAISAMVSAGARALEALAIVTDADEPTTPCGGCRQALFEFGPDAVVVSGTVRGARLRSSVPELLPLAFGPASFRPEPAPDRS